MRSHRGYAMPTVTDMPSNLRGLQGISAHEMETLAILEVLQKWEDELVGKKIHVITDHKALEFFKTQARLLSRQQRWMDYILRFDFDIMYVKGEKHDSYLGI
jgi:Holliday junction resolvase-like predicted endonuclease